ncbi:hypothetical protein [Pseudomonas syringae]|uniref:hypothetical protein n=1 Tax=Pseudomonas syringae TaxID=317 RepID=UPI003F74AFE6
MDQEKNIQPELTSELTDIGELVDEMLSYGFENSPLKTTNYLLEKINKQTITKDTQDRYFLTGDLIYLPERQQSCLIAMVYWHLAQKENASGNFTGAWRLLSRCSYFVGLTEGREEVKLPLGTRKRSETSRKNKLEVAKLIARKRPKEGWRREREAANSILNDAIELNKRLKLNLVESDLADRLTQWLKEDGSVARAAFLGRYSPESD